MSAPALRALAATARDQACAFAALEADWRRLERRWERTILVACVPGAGALVLALAGGLGIVLDGDVVAWATTVVGGIIAAASGWLVRWCQRRRAVAAVQAADCARWARERAAAAAECTAWATLAERYA